MALNYASKKVEINLAAQQEATLDIIQPIAITFTDGTTTGIKVTATFATEHNGKTAKLYQTSDATELGEMNTSTLTDQPYTDVQDDTKYYSVGGGQTIASGAAVWDNVKAYPGQSYGFACGIEQPDNAEV